jgi:hypothetical protein
MNTLKSLPKAVLFVAVLAFRCATASNRHQRIAVTADPPDAEVTASAIVALPVVAALIGVGLRIFAEETGAIHTHRPRATRVTLRPKE